jgi:DNA-binding NarL/FixJ family response regulator
MTRVTDHLHPQPPTVAEPGVRPRSPTVDWTSSRPQFSALGPAGPVSGNDRKIVSGPGGRPNGQDRDGLDRRHEVPSPRGTPKGAPDWVPLQRVVICDDRRPVLPMLTRKVSTVLPGVDIVCVADGVGLTNAFADESAGLVLIGIHSGSGDGADATDLLLALHPAAAVIVFGSTADIHLLAAAVARGARGLMLWDVASFRAAGGVLTDRELQVLQGMSQGHSNGRLGRELHLSEYTVKTHTSHLYAKLGARDRAHAVALGLRGGHIT